MRLIEKWEVELIWHWCEVEIIPVDNEDQALKIADYYETSERADAMYLDSTTIRRIRHYQFIEPSTLPSRRLIGEREKELY